MVFTRTAADETVGVGDDITFTWTVANYGDAITGLWHLTTNPGTLPLGTDDLGWNIVDDTFTPACVILPPLSGETFDTLECHTNLGSPPGIDFPADTSASVTVTRKATPADCHKSIGGKENFTYFRDGSPTTVRSSASVTVQCPNVVIGMTSPAALVTGQGHQVHDQSDRRWL